MSGNPTTFDSGDLFGRVVDILEQARTKVVRSVNSEMVVAYWLIGHEIVEEIQKGEERAGYAVELMARLSSQLNKRFGKGFSIANLKFFRQFYIVFVDRNPYRWYRSCRIRYTVCSEFGRIHAIPWMVPLSSADAGGASGSSNLL